MAISRNLPLSSAVAFIVFGLMLVNLGFYYAWVEPNGTNRTTLWTTPTEIKSINWDESTGPNQGVMEYTGNGTVTLNEVYANETLDAQAVITPRVLSKGQTAEITLSKTYVAKPTQITVRVATSDGLDAYKNKFFYAIWLEQVDWDQRTSKIRAVVRNSGDETVTLSEVYVNGNPDASAMPSPLILTERSRSRDNLVWNLHGYAHIYSD